MPDSRKQQAGRLGAHVSWANTTNRAARTAPARATFDQRFLDEAGGDEIRAGHLRKAYFLKLAMKSAAARKVHKDGGPDAA